MSQEQAVMTEAVEPIAEERLVRSDDPATSLAAAIKATKASRTCIAAIQVVMEDGAGRIDHEISEACRANGYLSSLSTVHHGRLALSEAGWIKDTGETRETPDGCQSRVWRKV